MKKIREYWPYKWEIETEPEIDSTMDIEDKSLCITHKFKIKILSPEQYVKEPVMALDLIKLIWALEKEWVFDKKESEYTTYTFNNPDKITTVPSIPPYNPLQPSILYSDHTILCQSGITGQWENGLKSQNI